MASNKREIQLDITQEVTSETNFLLNLRKNQIVKRQYLLWQISPKVWLEVY